MNKKKVIGLVLIILLVVICVIVAIFAFRSKNDEIFVEPSGPVLVFEGDDTTDDLKEYAEAVTEIVYEENNTLSEVMDAETFPEMFNLDKDSYEYSFGLKSNEEGCYDMILGFTTKSMEESQKLHDDLLAYLENIVNNPSDYPKEMVAAFEGAMVSYDIYNHVFLIATFGDLDSVSDKNKSEITEYAEENCFKVSSAIIDGLVAHFFEP